PAFSPLSLHDALPILRLGPNRIWMLNHPDLVEEVLVTHNRRFIKHFALRRARPSLGEGLLLSEGDFWRRQRKLAQPAFHRDRVRSEEHTSELQSRRDL